MLGEWYLPPGECQVIWTITEGTVSISHHAIHPLPTRIPQTPFPQADKSNNPRPTTVPRSGGLRVLSGPSCWSIHQHSQVRIGKSESDWTRPASSIGASPRRPRGTTHNPG